MEVTIDGHLEYLIERLNAGADRTLDYDIANYISHDADADAPSYTTSIDAALTLLPRGWRVEELFIGADKSSSVELTKIRGRGPILRARGSSEKSAALALCVAALKARVQV